MFTGNESGPATYVLIYPPNGCGRPWPLFLGLNYYANASVDADPGITLSRGYAEAAVGSL
jgi:hypothetical protein